MKIDMDTCEEILITITRNKTRSLLTAFGVFWGIFMLVALIGGGQGLEEMMKKNFEGFATNSGFLAAQRTGEAYKGFRKGARPKDILQQILSESIVLTALAGMCGISFAVIVLQLTEMAANSNGGDIRFQVTFGLAVGTCILLIALGMLAGLAPAYRAMAIKPIEAIREE